MYSDKFRGYDPFRETVVFVISERKRRKPRRSVACRCRMQPLVSPVGHGVAYNSYSGDEEVRVSETTPLVRFPEPHQPAWSARTGITFGILMALLAFGSIISIYLLYLQSNSDHLLPPVDTPLLLIRRKEWCRVPSLPPASADVISAPSEHIVVVQTGTSTCNDILVCTELLHELQSKEDGHLPYNFLVSSNGVTFEALGWTNRSPMFPQLSAVVVAFIGNFTKDIPTTSQLEEAFTLFDASNVDGHVTHDFTIIGKITESGDVPTYLFASLQNLTQWDPVLSDDY